MMVIIHSRHINLFLNIASLEPLETFTNKGPQIFPKGRINPNNVNRDIRFNCFILYHAHAILPSGILSHILRLARR